MRILFYGVVTLVTLILCLSYGDYQLIPKYGTRQTMAQSTAYHEGSTTELYLLKRRYESADAVSKAIIREAAIRAAALHEFEMFPEDRLPADLRSWLGSL